MANKILHATIMQKNTIGGKNIIYPKTVTKNIIDGSSTLDQTLNTLKSSDISNKTVTFTQASTRENLVSGETLATSQGKIMKLISDLKSLAYIDQVGVSNLDSTLASAYNNRITTDMVTVSTSITSSGYVADARAVNNLQNQINTVNSNINGVLNAKIFASNVDDIFTGGCYDINPSTQGTLPEVNGYAILFVRTANTTWVYQDLIYTDTVNFKHYHRMNINSDGWTEWEKYASSKDVGKCWNLDGGTYIPASTNLDDIKTIGSYYNQSNNESATITNNPTSLAFTMQVYASNGQANYYVTQELRSYSSDDGIYIRKYSDFSKTWSKWIKLVQDSDLKTPVLSSGTILDLVLKQITNKVFFIVQTYYPSDIPEQNEGFLEILVDKAAYAEGIGRRLVRYTTYTGNKIYQRRTFHSEWESNWYLFEGKEVT